MQAFPESKRRSGRWSTGSNLTLRQPESRNSIASPLQSTASAKLLASISSGEQNWSRNFVIRIGWQRLAAWSPAWHMKCATLASVKLKLHLATEAGVSDPERLANAFAVVRTEVDRIDRLVERLLALGKPPKTSLQNLDIARYLAERLEFFAPRATGQNTALELRSSPSLNGTFGVDRERLGEVIDNLIANALDATSDGGRVVVEAECDEEQHQMLIRVKDNGGGVPAAVRDRLFEPFATTKESGMGLGLFLSAEIVRGLGGEISYREFQEAVQSNGKRDES